MITRRQFFSIAGGAAAGCLAHSLPAWGSPVSSTDTGRSTSGFLPDVELRLTSMPTEVPLFKGSPTAVWAYRGEVIKGPPESLVHLKSSFLGPVIRVRKGQKVRVHFENRIPASSIIHWHGLHVPQEMDGHPRFAVPQGETYRYDFEVVDRSGTYWYHPHPHGRTGHQVYGGMAGLFLVTDDEEAELDLPSGDYEVPLVIQDRSFNMDNQLVYLSGGMMGRMTGHMGDVILVNGRPRFTLKAATRVYRLRILNGSNARVYNLAWDDGSHLTVIGTDGGLLTRPLKRSSVLIGPGERLDVWADFTRYAEGTGPNLISGGFDAGTAGTMGGGRMGRGMMGPVLPNGAPFQVMEVEIAKKEKEHRRLPERLSKLPPPSVEDAVNIELPRKFELSMFHMHGLINGRSFQMTQVADDEIVQADTTEIWEFTNPSGQMGMMGMTIPHPMHLHGAKFRVLGRAGVSQSGHQDEGWKDTVLLMPGERIRLLVRFGKYSGLFLYHCHNLEHGDAGMMRNYLIKSDQGIRIL
ncbi:Multicopper oxidase [Olavius algarvensis associated proteobacterium Delta 3]|nr:Multicopper oxidase [Olavius algarvensis associated proteobacterium Delta 3]